MIFMELLRQIRTAILISGEYTSEAEYRQILSAISDDPRSLLALRLIWEYGMSTTELCSLKRRNVDSYGMFITITGEGYVPSSAARKIKIRPSDDDLFDLYGKVTDGIVSDYVFQQKYASKTGTMINPNDFMKFITQKVLKKTGIKITLRSLFRGRFVDMVENGTTNMYDVLKVFGSENISKMGIMEMGGKQ